MSLLLSAFSRPATRWPATVLLALLLVTVMAGVAATGLVMETDLAEFGREDSEVVQGRDRVTEEFDRSGAAIQVIVDTGEDGNVFTSAGLRRLDEVTEIVERELGDDLRRDADGDPRLRSLAPALHGALEQAGGGSGQISDDAVATAAARSLAARPELAGLTSADRDIQAGTARAVTIVAELDPDLSSSERVAAADRLREPIGIPEEGFRSSFGGIDVIISSMELTNDALQTETQNEAPLLLALAMGVVALVLLWLLRSVFDVLVGLGGIIATVVWTFGLIAVLGPEHLDLVGPVSQVGVVVPVLVVGLGIDYAVHLTTRYREQRALGQDAPTAAKTAMHTVGGALVLATVATAVGFGVTGMAPLEVIADFGIFTAIGVICAFIVMGLAVPASRVLRERRLGPSVRGPRGLDLRALLGAVSRAATSRPVLPLLLALVIVTGSLWLAADLETRFDRDDFVPADSEIGSVLALQEELFDGELTETTYVLVDGDATDPDLLEAIRQGHDDLTELESVRTTPGGQPQATSIVTLSGPSDDGGGAPAGAERSRFVRADDGALLVEVRTNAGDSGATELADGLERAFSGVEEAGGSLVVTSDALIIAEMADELRDFQLRSIATTLLAVLLLLSGYYAVAHRRPMLGVISMIPPVLGASLLLGTMGLFDISFDAMTATLTAIAVGIGVPYGVHVTNRFTEERRHEEDPVVAGATTLATTGGALAGSALTTFGAFAVLSFSGLALISQLGVLGAAGILFALLGAALVQPGALVLWARVHDRRRRRRDARRTKRHGTVPPAMVANPLTGEPSDETGLPATPSSDNGVSVPAAPTPPPPPTARGNGVAPATSAPSIPETPTGSGRGERVTFHLDDPRFASCRVELERRDGQVRVCSVELRAQGSTRSGLVEIARFPLDRCLELAVAAARLEADEPVALT
ncbi:MAG: MMPL family transporter [Nitriliruptoraceae bacterium]